jgi:hypothetical protein
LPEIDGDPSPAADQAYARQRADIEITGQTRLPFGTVFELFLKAGEKSQLVTVVTYAIAVIMGIAAGLGLRVMGLSPIAAATGGSLVWVVLSAVVFYRHRHK